jgi:hypothetical protein
MVRETMAAFQQRKEEKFFGSFFFKKEPLPSYQVQIESKSCHPALNRRSQKDFLAA